MAILRIERSRPFATSPKFAFSAGKVRHQRRSSRAVALSLGESGDPFSINVYCPRSAYELEAIRVTATLAGQTPRPPFLAKLETSPEVEIQGSPGSLTKRYVRCTAGRPDMRSRAPQLRGIGEPLHGIFDAGA